MPEDIETINAKIKALETIRDALTKASADPDLVPLDEVRVATKEDELVALEMKPEGSVKKEPEVGLVTQGPSCTSYLNICNKDKIRVLECNPNYSPIRFIPGMYAPEGKSLTNSESTLHLSIPRSLNPIGAMTIDVETFGNIDNARKSHFFRVRDIGANYHTPFIISGDGNVGIGTGSPSRPLDVWGDASVHGNLSIGTDSPSTSLDVWGDASVHGNIIANEHMAVNGDVNVNGDVKLIGADCAEDFNVNDAESVEPGTVMVINKDGALQPSQQSYDKRVAGVISGAGDLRPGIRLDQQSGENRLPLALTGKVYCKLDAQYGAVEVGDLLTTSPTYGHAMKAADPSKAFGSVIGKALSPQEEGRGMIPILIALQ